ncbi:rootletin [Trichonephila clavipes]|nr:rootletin [Trichonephila clavipes]
MCLFLRSILGLGSDSGFMSVSSNLQSSPGPSRGVSSEKLTEVSRSSLRDSPHRFNVSKSSYPAQLNLSDLDIDLLKSSLKDLILKFNAVEKERDEQKDVVAKLQRETDELKGEHTQCISKIYQLKRDLEDKKNVEKDLATKIAKIYHCEEVIRTLEREKRRLTEKIGNAEFFSSSNSKEKESLLDKISELKNNELKLHEEILASNTEKEAAEIRASKCIQRFQSLETDIELFKEAIDNKDYEMKTGGRSEAAPVNHLVMSLQRHCCRVSAADKGWRVYPLDPHPDAVALYSGCTPDSPLTVSPHTSLNTPCGIVSEPDLLITPEAEILDGFSDQGVIQLLEQKLDAANKKFKTSDSQTKSLELTIDHLSNEIKKYSKNEQLLTEKVKTLSSSLAQTSSSQQSLYEELEKKQKESLKNQTELFKMQQTNEQFKTSVMEYKLKNESLRNEVEELKRNLIQMETTRQEQLEQIRKMQNLLVMSDNQEKEALQQMQEFQKQKDFLEERVRSLSSALRKTNEEVEEKEELCQQLKKESANLKKSLNKIEKERMHNSEMTAKSILEKSSLGKSLRQMEIENQTLQQRVQNLQAQLTELEERHSQRMNEFLKSQASESKLEENRLRIALRHAERQLEEKEKTYRRKILGLEKQIAVLKSHLENDQKKWQQYHHHSLSASANINYLHSVLSNSLQNVSDDPQKLLSEAERLDATTETELNATGVSVMTPSKLHHSNSYIQRTSTPKAKKKLDMSFKS